MLVNVIVDSSQESSPQTYSAYQAMNIPCGGNGIARTFLHFSVTGIFMYSDNVTHLIVRVALVKSSFYKKIIEKVAVQLVAPGKTLLEGL